jgi:hypothetical protein
MTAPFATALLGWKLSSKNKLGWPLVPNFADVDNAESIRIAAGVLDALDVDREVNPIVPLSPGGPLERSVCDHLGQELVRLHADREWLVGRGMVIAGFDQYAHLSQVDALVRANVSRRTPTLSRLTRGVR